MNVESNGCSSTQHESEGVERRPAFHAERSCADTYRPPSDPEDKNVSGLHPRQRAPVQNPSRGKRRVVDADLRECILRNPSLALCELFELELLAIIVIDDVNGVLAAPDLEVCGRAHPDRRHPD